MKNLPLHIKIVIGLILVVLWAFISSFLGWNTFTINWIDPFGAIFIRLLKFIAVPLVLFSIISGISGLTDISKLGRMGVKTLGLYLVTTIVAVLVGLSWAGSGGGARGHARVTLEPHVGVLQATRSGEHVRQRQLDQRGCRSARGVQHPAPGRPGRLDVNVVDAHPCTADDAQAPTGASLDDLGSERRGRTDDDRIVLAEGRAELRLRVVALDNVGAG